MEFKQRKCHFLFFSIFRIKIGNGSDDGNQDVEFVLPIVTEEIVSNTTIMKNAISIPLNSFPSCEKPLIVKPVLLDYEIP